MKEKEIKKLIFVSFPYLENKCEISKTFKKEFFLMKFKEESLFEQFMKETQDGFEFNRKQVKVSELKDRQN